MKNLSLSILIISIAGILILITAVNNNICWVAGDSGVIMKTTDGGNTWWTQKMPVVVSLRRISFAGALK